MVNAIQKNRARKGLEYVGMQRKQVFLLSLFIWNSKNGSHARSLNKLLLRKLGGICDWLNMVISLLLDWQILCATKRRRKKIKTYKEDCYHGVLGPSQKIKSHFFHKLIIMRNSSVDKCIVYSFGYVTSSPVPLKTHFFLFVLYL